MNLILASFSIYNQTLAHKSRLKLMLFQMGVNRFHSIFGRIQTMHLSFATSYCTDIDLYCLNHHK